MFELEFFIGYGLFIGVFVTGYLFFKSNKSKKNKIHRINPNEFNQMYKIIETKGGIDKEPWKRKISPRVIKKFYLIARANSIDINTMTDEQFDFIYRTYTDRIVNKYLNS